MTQVSRRDGCLYTGRVTHARLTPTLHSFGYRAFYTLFDLNGIDEVAARLRFFSRNRTNLMSFHDADHLGADARPIREKARSLLRDAGIDIGSGRILLLCMPRLFGYVFNPISVYFCHDADGALVCMMYEVRNTFGQQHTYVVPVDDDARHADTIHQTCQKSFYVSPFMDMDLTYSFDVRRPAGQALLGIAATRGDVPVIRTLFAGRRDELTDPAILRVLATYPLMTLKVFGAIHWEALRLWLKGLRIKPRPEAPAMSVSFEVSKKSGAHT